MIGTLIGIILALIVLGAGGRSYALPMHPSPQHPEYDPRPSVCRDDSD